jgi:preprotein translocase subunit SecD
MGNFKKIFKNVRILILIVFLVLSVVAINPSFSKEGVAVRGVGNGTAAANAQPSFSINQNSAPRSREVILAINNEPVKNLQDYARITAQLKPYQNITVTTNKNAEQYRVMVQPKFTLNETGEFEERNVTVERFDEELNETVNVTQVEKIPILEKNIIGIEDLGFNVYPRPSSNLGLGLDLAGGTRVLLRPESKASPEEIDLVVQNIRQRLNIFGLSDIVVRPTKDLSGQSYISVEIAGVNREDIVGLLKEQGKFEAKIGGNTVFIGGKNDIPYVCLSADCSGIDARQGGCRQDANNEWICTFRFAITISAEAAQRQANATKDLPTLTEGDQTYLNESLDLFLDDELVDSLRVSSVFKGNPLTDIEISGPGRGKTQETAGRDALDNMKRLQTILKTGSLPVKLEIVKTDSISPVLGQKFSRNALIVGFLAVIAVGLVILVRYRTVSVALPIVITMVSEGVIILGVAAFIRWNLDLAAIAGIIVAIGTGVDSQIVIADETIRGETQESSRWKDRMKRAFFIIMGSYATLVVAMIPLFYAGAGLLRGFALTTIIGASIGVFVTRPAYGQFIHIFHKDKEEKEK